MVPSYQVTKLQSYQVTRLPSYHATKLLSYHVTQLPHYQVSKLPSDQVTKLLCLNLPLPGRLVDGRRLYKIINATEHTHTLGYRSIETESFFLFFFVNTVG